VLKAPCEKLARYVLPAVRSMLVYHMYAERGMSQLQIARITGMSQSTISRYLNNERGLYRAIVARLPGISPVLDEMVKRMVSGERVDICTACRLLEERGLLGEALAFIMESTGKKKL